MSNSTAVNMTYRFQMNDERLVTLPDVICSELGFQLGDILIREVTDNASKLTLRKHRVQTLTDDEIALAGNLTRVIPLESD
jgi:hypothetical protein